MGIALLALLSTCKGAIGDGDDGDGNEESVYSVIYDGNGSTGGSVPTDTAKYAAGKTATVKANTGGLVKSHYEFSAWNAKADESGVAYAPGASLVMGASDVTLYAIWAKSGITKWAKSVLSSSNSNQFKGLAADASGNIYCVGSHYDNEVFFYGPAASVIGYSASSSTAVIVKYDASGNVVWAKGAENSNDKGSNFYSVAVDSAGNVYAAGWQQGTGAFSYGGASAASVTGCAAGYNAVLVKYSASGEAQWAKSVTGATGVSAFQGVAVDASGGVYAVGYQENNTEDYLYGVSPLVSARGPYSGMSALVVKYDSSGTAKWAKCPVTGPNESAFSAVAADSSGSAYCAGHQTSSGAFVYGTGASVAGGYSGLNAVLVKYDSTGTAKWADGAGGSGIGSSFFRAAAVDSSGNPVAAGYIEGTVSYSFGSGVSAAGGCASKRSSVVVKYGPSGNASWAKSVTFSADNSEYNSLTSGAAGSVYAAGYQSGSGSFTYATGTSVNGSSSNSNVALVKYDASGEVQFARTSASGTDSSAFNAAACSSAGGVCAAGIQTGTNPSGYGDGVTVTPGNSNSGAYNVLTVTYSP